MANIITDPRFEGQGYEFFHKPTQNRIMYITEGLFRNKLARYSNIANGWVIIREATEDDMIAMRNAGVFDQYGSDKKDNTLEGFELS